MPWFCCAVLCCTGLFYRRLVTDWKYPPGSGDIREWENGEGPSSEDANANTAAAAKPAYTRGAKPAAKAPPASAKAKATPKAKAKATPKAKRSVKKVVAKKAAAAAAPAPSFSSDEDDFDEDEAIKMESEVVPAALRYDSPGRKASLSIFVEGKRRRKSPARFVAKN